MRTLALMFLACSLALTQGKPEVRQVSFKGKGASALACSIPKAWVDQATTSASRLAQWAIGKKDKATLTVYWFGKKGAGTSKANLARWQKQLKGKDVATTSPATPKGFKAHMVDKSGTYVAEVRPGSPQRRNEKDWRMLAAVLETPEGPLYLKFVGPAKTVAQGEAEFLALLNSFKVVRPVKK